MASVKIKKLKSLEKDPLSTTYQIQIENYANMALDEHRLLIEIVEKLKQHIIEQQILEIQEKMLPKINEKLLEILPNLINKIGEHIVLSGIKKIIKE